MLEQAKERISIVSIKAEGHQSCTMGQKGFEPSLLLGINLNLLYFIFPWATTEVLAFVIGATFPGLNIMDGSSIDSRTLLLQSTGERIYTG